MKVWSLAPVLSLRGLELTQINYRTLLLAHDLSVLTFCEASSASWANLSQFSVISRQPACLSRSAVSVAIRRHSSACKRYCSGEAMVKHFIHSSLINGINGRSSLALATAAIVGKDSRVGALGRAFGPLSA
jgi:hypothetical protein